MRKIIVAMAWAAVLIGLPLFAKAGVISAATADSMAPTLTVLAAFHVAVFGSKKACRSVKGQQA